MEYIDGMLINNIIHYFKQSTAGIKSKNQVFIIAIINLLFINEVSNGMANIRIANIMLKGRLIEFNVVFKHVSSIDSFLRIVKKTQNFRQAARSICHQNFKLTVCADRHYNKGE